MLFHDFSDSEEENSGDNGLIVVYDLGEPSYHQGQVDSSDDDYTEEDFIDDMTESERQHDEDSEEDFKEESFEFADLQLSEEESKEPQRPVTDDEWIGELEIHTEDLGSLAFVEDPP